MTAEIPDPPTHVMANYLLNHELEAAYLNEPRKFRLARGNSTIAFKKFHSTDFKVRETLRREYFEELAQAVEDIESRLPVGRNSSHTSHEHTRRY